MSSGTKQDYVSNLTYIFSFKLAELPMLKKINQEEALCYLFLWDCIIYLCAYSPMELRSLYTMWLYEKTYAQVRKCDSLIIVS